MPIFTSVTSKIYNIGDFVPELGVVLQAPRVGYTGHLVIEITSTYQLIDWNRFGDLVSQQTRYTWQH